MQDSEDRAGRQQNGAGDWVGFASHVVECACSDAHLMGRLSLQKGHPSGHPVRSDVGKTAAVFEEIDSGCCVEQTSPR